MGRWRLGNGSTPVSAEYPSLISIRGSLAYNLGSISHFGELLVQPSLAVDLVAKEFRNLRYLYRHSFVSNTLYECIRTFVCVEFVTNVTHCTGQCHVVKSKCLSFVTCCQLCLIFGNMSLIAKQDTIYSFHRIIHLVSSGYISTH